MGDVIQMNRTRPPKFNPDLNLNGRNPCLIQMPLGNPHHAYTDGVVRAGNYYEVYIPGRDFMDIRAEYVILNP